jgi:hypothetical protein
VKVPDEDRPLLTPGASSPDDSAPPSVESLVAWTGDRATFRRRLEAEAESEEWRTAIQDYTPLGAREALAIERAQYALRSDLVFKFPTCAEPGCTRSGVFAGPASEYDPSGYLCRKHRPSRPRNRPKKAPMRIVEREAVQPLPSTVPPGGGGCMPGSEVTE